MGEASESPSDPAVVVAYETGLVTPGDHDQSEEQPTGASRLPRRSSMTTRLSEVGRRRPASES
jgi:hypothetical protein